MFMKNSPKYLARPLFYMGILALVFVGWGASFAQESDKNGPPKEIPKPTILESRRYIALKNGSLARLARYTIVRSKHSDRVFAGGLQRKVSGKKTWESFSRLSKRKKGKLYAGMTAHHFEYAASGPLEKYKGWIQGGGKRIDYVLVRSSGGFNSWREGSGGNRARSAVAPLGSVPFDSTQIMLVRMAFKKAQRNGGSVSVVDPRTLKTGVLTVAKIGDNQYQLSGLGASGTLEMSPSGAIARYTVGDLEFIPEPPK